MVELNSDVDLRTSRRTVVRTAAWSVPVVAVAAAAPAFAASAVATASAGPALKWSDALKHVSWDLTLTSGSRAIAGVSIAFTYTPNGGGGTGTFTNLDIYTFLPSVDTTWQVAGVTAAGSNSATATHTSAPIPAFTTSSIHTDFSGSDNSSGSVSARITLTYAGGATETLPTLTVGWAQASPGNKEPAPHNTH